MKRFPAQQQNQLRKFNQSSFGKLVIVASTCINLLLFYFIIIRKPKIEYNYDLMAFVAYDSTVRENKFHYWFVGVSHFSVDCIFNFQFSTQYAFCMCVYLSHTVQVTQNFTRVFSGESLIFIKGFMIVQKVTSD